MIEVSYYYTRGDGKWTLCTNYFHKKEKALRFLFMLKKHPKMVFMELHADDTWEAEWLRRKASL